MRPDEAIAAPPQPRGDRCAERDLILWLAREVPVDERFYALLAEADLGVLADELVRLKLLGLLGQRLVRAVPPDALDAGFLATLEARLTAGRQDALHKQTITWGLLQMLRAGGITTVPLKGPFLAERLHGDAGFRRSGDIDLLVSASDLPAAIAVLERTGYWRPRISDSLPLLHHIFLAQDGPPVELHWRIHWYESEYADGLLNRSVLDGDVRRPDVTDDLVALLLFYARDGLSGLSAPVDIAAWWSKYGTSLNRDELIGTVRRHPALSRPIAAAALAVERLLGVPISPYLDPRALHHGRTLAAVSLADYSPRAIRDTDVVTKVVDGLLTNPTGIGRFIRRAAFPQVPGRPATRLVRQLLYALYLTRSAAPILWRLTRREPSDGRTSKPTEPGVPSSPLSRFFALNRTCSKALEQRLRIPSDKPFWARFHQLVAAALQDLPDRAMFVDLGGGRRCVYASAIPREREVRLIAVDISADELAANEVADEKILADVTKGLPFADREVDLLVSRALLEHVENLPAAVAQIARVIKPTGRTIHFAPSRNALFALAARLLPFDLLLRILHFAKPDSVAQVDFEVHYDQTDPIAIRRVFADAGFRNVTVEWTAAQADYFTPVAPAYLLVALYQALVTAMGFSRLASYLIVSADGPQDSAS